MRVCRRSADRGAGPGWPRVTPETETRGCGAWRGPVRYGDRTAPRTGGRELGKSCGRAGIHGSRSRSGVCYVTSPKLPSGADGSKLGMVQNGRAPRDSVTCAVRERQAVRTRPFQPTGRRHPKSSGTDPPSTGPRRWDPEVRLASPSFSTCGPLIESARKPASANR